MARIRVMPDGWNIPAPLMAKSIRMTLNMTTLSRNRRWRRFFCGRSCDVENYDDARKAAAAIEDYFRNHGGTAEQTEAKGLELD